MRSPTAPRRPAGAWDGPEPATNAMSALDVESSHRMEDKLATMTEAIERNVPDGSSIALGCALEPLIPFAAAHELIRQGRRDLTLIGPISDILFDQLIGAGCVARVIAAWVGNVSEGLGYNYRRATEQGHPRPLAVEDHSNYSISLALLAGALGVPYMPMRSLLGSDIARDYPSMRAPLAAGRHADAAGARTAAGCGDRTRPAGGCAGARTRLGWLGHLRGSGACRPRGDLHGGGDRGRRRHTE